MASNTTAHDADRPDADDTIPLNEIPRHLPGRRRPHKSTIHRWWTRGVRGVRLKTCLVVGRRYTRIRWVEEFLNAINAEAQGTPLSSNTTRHREQAIRTAEASLAAEGVGPLDAPA